MLCYGLKCKLSVFDACAINVIDKIRAIVLVSENVSVVCDQTVSKDGVHKLLREGYYSRATVHEPLNYKEECTLGGRQHWSTEIL